VLRGPGGTIRIDGQGITIEGILIQFKGPVTFESNGVGNSLSITGNAFEGEPIENALTLEYTYADLKPVVGAPFRIIFDDGSQRQGQLDAEGKATIVNPPDAGTVYFGYDAREAFPLQERPANALYGFKPTSPEDAKRAIERYKAQEEAYMQDNYFPDEIQALVSGVDYDDLVEDYEYDEEIAPQHEEEDDSPGTHQEVMLDDDNEDKA
jgi:type VI secretion system secreted protein VgrG